MLNLQTDKILQQEMDRKLFLKTTGFALVGLIGVAAIAKRLDVFGSALTTSGAVTSLPTTKGMQRQSSASLSYGNSAYGI